MKRRCVTDYREEHLKRNEKVIYLTAYVNIVNFVKLASYLA